MMSRIHDHTLHLGPACATIVTVAACVLVDFRADIRQTDAEIRQMACTQKLKRYATALSMYVSDYDEVFPPMKSAAIVRPLILPYARDASVFVCSNTGAQYLPNPALGYRTESSIRSAAKTLIFRDAKPHGPAQHAPTLPTVPWWNAVFWDRHVEVALAEPALGKPSYPLPKSTLMKQRIQQIDKQIRLERKWKNDIEWEIRRLTAERDKLTKELRRSKQRKPGRA